MKIYTKTGDQGETSLLGGKRVFKNCVEMEAIGEVDELNSFLGTLISYLDEKFDIEKKSLQKIQNKLFNLGSNLAAVQTDLVKIPKIKDNDLEFLENNIDEMSIELPELTQFILPGGSVTASLAFQARAVCRRAERVIIKLDQHYELETNIPKYLNRLSDYLFTLARYLNKKESIAEVTWEK
ncbi:MAG: ATP:cob(I)alamin adenosyltransferase [Candidatus Magasanikbacteria bacterium CG_4_10_14_0_2_um_filter_33_14]|uniref:Corrinoid adenosyltransferase n=1 Tax=Candidatus Magasanikbacteria bacterium CG_4_10_14_0_2_um_filter_33_14 TaxID=1974636 RepID=A0A2M7VA91_9BACT|nr:MAG: ATP:cob(I)alamin adenosyltransferase [Candidatus Magasanikbacteria bacterium CG_4_10_14_0_2_um_filter_33_14]